MVDLALNLMNEEQLNKVVYDVFDELFTKLATSGSGVPVAERRNRKNNFPLKGKIYEHYSPHHGFCKLCEQHFFKFSVVEDINSFFQNHLNTSYHRQQRSTWPCPDDVPTLSWEVPLVSARCNLCDLGGLKAFVVSTTLSIQELLAIHNCVFPLIQPENSENCMLKLNLLKYYCELSAFREKFIRKINARSVCLLCELTLPWAEDKVVCHLHSDRHYQKFCELVRVKLNFRLTDVLNGFNLEAVTRFILTYQFPSRTKFTDSTELEMCLSDSNSNADPYGADVPSAGFSPSYVESQLQIHNSDFIYNNLCLLCNSTLEPGHFQCPIHLVKSMFVSEASFRPKNYDLYLKQRKNRLLPLTQIIRYYYNFKTKESSLLESQHSNATSCIDYLTNKLASITLMETVRDIQVFCQVCERFMSQLCSDFHLNSDDHEKAIMKLKELMETCLKQRFVKPFKQVKDAIVCLLCPAAMDNIFLHLNSEKHRRQLQFYCELDLKIPLSSMFKFENDHSCFCTICNHLLAKESHSLSLQDVHSHFPCPGMQKWQKDLTKAQGEEKSGSPIHLELKKVEREVVHVLSAFERTIIENVCKKSVIFLKSLTKSDVVDSEAPVVQQPSTHFCTSESSSDSKRDNRSNSAKQRAKVKTVKSNKHVCYNQMMKVLVIKGLAEYKKNRIFIRSRFERLARLRFVEFQEDDVIVGFQKQQIVERMVKTAKNLLIEPKVEVAAVMMTVKEIMLKEKKASESLKMKLRSLLKKPDKLTKFASSLVSQAQSVSQSQVEMTKEANLCSMIASSASLHFPRCRCYPFGSRLTELSVGHSDLDVFLDCGNAFDGFSQPLQSNAINKVAKALRSSRQVSEMTVTLRARVPIVSFFHKPTGLNCDLSFCNGLGVRNSLLLKYLMSLDWRVRPLILFVRHWAKENDLQSRPFFSSYALSMLVVNYLEQLQPPILPTIESLQNSHVGPRITINGWDCSFNDSDGNFFKSKNMMEFPSLVEGFFEFYGNFNFVENVVFPLTGEPLPRKAFSYEGRRRLPFCFKRQILNIPAPLENLVDNCHPICVIDPFELNFVLTKSISAQVVSRFQQLCLSSMNLLKEAILSRKEN